ncbi:MAG: hypothetical protein M3Z24_02165 [Chloroflexota bacterium]|nr:hypothetical protein [Chloroflexota bacterium]
MSKGLDILIGVTVIPEVESPSTETQPQHEVGGWSIETDPLVGLALGSDDELLMLENKTPVSWLVYHNYHRLSIIDPGELLAFHLYKHGSLSVRPLYESDATEYLVLELGFDVTYVHIYRRQMAENVEVYDMSATLSNQPERRHRHHRRRRDEAE